MLNQEEEMHYQCVNCDWKGPWDELIHETMCPRCRSGARPLLQNDGMAAQAAHGIADAVTVNSPPQ